MAKWEENLPLSLLKQLLFTCVENGESFRTLFHECGGDGSTNVLLPSKADQNELRDLKFGDVVLVIQPDAPRGRWPLMRILFK